MFLQNEGLSKTGLDNCLESPVSKNHLTSNIVNGPKHCRNLNKSTFIILIDQRERN